jgi:hypothetical protein
LTAHGPARWGTWKAHLLVVALLGLLTAVMTWPMVAHWSTAVLGPPGDNLEYVWKMWWFKHALLERGVSPMFNPDVFYPFGYPLAMGETTVAHTLLGLPITALFGEVVAYNTVVFLSFVLSGYSVYLLLRELGCGGAAALLGGVAFAFSPYRMSHLGAGHLPLMGTGWIALFFLFLERTLTRPSWCRGVLTGVFFALTALSSWYYAVIVGAFGVLYALLRGRKVAEGGRPATRTRARALLAGALVAAALVAPMAAPVVRLYQQGEMQYEHSLKYVDRWSASLVDFFCPNAMHPLWGEALTTRYYQNTNEHLLYLGAVPLALAAVGLWVRRRERLARVFAVLGGIALVLAMGTTVHFGGDPVYVPVSAETERRFCDFMDKVAWQYALNKVDYRSLRLDNGIVIPLPMLFIYLFTPLVGSMRVWARFGMMTMFCTAVLAGWGADWVLARLRGGAARKRWLVSGALVALLLVDFAVLPYPYGYTEAKAQPVDAWLADQPNAPVVHFPLEKTWYGWMLYATRVHGQPAVYGYGTFAPQEVRQSAQVLETWPSEEALALLREWGVRYVLAGERSYGEEWPAVRAAMDALPGLEEVAVFEDEPRFHADRLLHLVRPSPNVPVTELITGEHQAYLADLIHVYVIDPQPRD